MDNIKSIPAEATDLSVHVDLCQQRWEAVYKRVKSLNVICTLLLIEATISTLREITDVPASMWVREIIKLLLPS